MDKSQATSPQGTPLTGPGKWTVVSFGVVVLGALVFFIAAAAGQKGGEKLVDNLWLGIPGIVAFGGAIVSAVTGWIAVLGRHNRTTGVVVATATSTVVSLFVALSLIFG